MPSERQVNLRGLAAHLRAVAVARWIGWLVQHHSWSPTAKQCHGISTVRGIRRYHMNVRGWSDNGYHIIVTPQGEIFICRPLHRSGGHCIARNPDSVGVCFLGNFDTGHDAPPEKWPGYPLLVSTVALICARFRIPIERVMPHSYYDPKTCPGTGFSMGEFRRAVRAAMANEIAPGGKPVKIVILPDNELVDCNGRVEGGTTRADLRPLLEALGHQVHDHLADQKKIYVQREVTTT